MTLEDDQINWSSFYQAYTGISFSIKKDNCTVFVPNYKNLSHSKTPSLSGTEMAFQDEWTSHTFLIDGSPEKIDQVLLKQLWDYAQNNILWDDFSEKLSFKDIEVNEVSLYEFAKDLDTFMVYHKLTKFGNVWWVGRVSTDLEGTETDFANVYLPNISGSSSTQAIEKISFWSADKHLNDELKKYSSNPLSYNGFLVSNDFNNGGWFTIPDMKVSTRPFEKLKIAEVLLNLNFTFEPTPYFGRYYSIDSTLGSRIKDMTSDVTLDITQAKTGQNDGLYTDTLINHWVGGLVSTENLTTLGETGNFKADPCVPNPPPEPAPTEISHAIVAQITLNPEYDPTKKYMIGTIDPINWRSSEIQKNAHDIGILNTSRSFGGANGTIDGGLVYGGIKTDEFGPSVLDSTEIWNGLGFLKNIQPHSSNPRCFHVQGGAGSKTLAAIGGFAGFNTDDYKQFQEYGKSRVLGGIEVFVQSEDPNISYFKTVPNCSLNTARGDAAGTLDVSVQDRKNKFEATDALKTIANGKDAEQTIAEFIANSSGQDDYKRYSVFNIQGFIYGGNTSGNSYMTGVANGDIISSFEKINSVFVDVGITDEELIDIGSDQPFGECKEIIESVVTIPCNDGGGVTVNLEKCGKYRLTYLSGAGYRGANYNSQILVYVNGIKEPNVAFNSPTTNSRIATETYFERHPTSTKFDVCSTIEKSKLTMVFNASKFSKTGGVINVQVCYLGTNEDCGCTNVVPEVTSVSVSYVTTNPALTYPVNCHGMRYVGSQNNGLSTGGRCEYNTIPEVEALLIEKYSNGYNINVDNSETQADLQKSRVLDLAYKYDGLTWTRVQNLLESVYYHAGVGDDVHSVFWGGLHESISNYQFSYVNDLSAAPTPSFDDWDCSNRDIKTSSVLTQGRNYTASLAGSDCWVSPTWESISAGLLFDNPTYTQGNAVLAYARDPNFPRLEATGLYPNAVYTFPVSQTLSDLDYVYPSTESIQISGDFSSGSSFQIQAQTVSGAVTSTLEGNIFIDKISFDFINNAQLYPNDVNVGTISNEVKVLTLSEVSLLADSVDISYAIRHSFTYDSLSGAGSNLPYAISGTGTFSFNTMDEIFNGGVVPSEFISTPINSMFVQMAGVPTSGAEGVILTGTASVLFDMADQQGVMIGVETRDETWASSLESCGDNITSFLNINTSFNGASEERWGVPLWSSAFVDGSAVFTLNYDFDTRQEFSDGIIGDEEYAITTISASATSVAAILNNRVLIKGASLEQDHSYISINGIGVPSVSANDCETITAAVSASFSIGVSGTGYSEYATAFIQEYQNDQRFKIPEFWVESNGYGIKPENTGTLYKKSYWKRYMDGVGLGGDAPDYDTIFNVITDKPYSVSQWSEIGKWHVGQMAFGTPDRAVVVGGHKVDRITGQTGLGSGLHAGITTPRVFIWDILVIPEEDTYLKNYLGRRFHSVYKNDSSTIPISSNKTNSDLSVVIFNAESDIVVERYGSISFDGASNQIPVTFDEPLPDEVGTNYSIAFTPNDNVELWWTDKTVNGFTINVGIKTWIGKVDYLATAVIKVTEQDIEEKGPTDGYIFNK